MGFISIMEVTHGSVFVRLSLNLLAPIDLASYCVCGIGTQEVDIKLDMELATYKVFVRFAKTKGRLLRLRWKVVHSFLRVRERKKAYNLYRNLLLIHCCYTGSNYHSMFF